MAVVPGSDLCSQDSIIFGEFAILTTKDLNIRYTPLLPYIIRGKFAFFTRDSNGQHDVM